MMIETLARPIEPRRLPYFSQAQLEQLFEAHERFLRRQPRSKNLVQRFLQAKGLNFSRRLLSEADLTGANLRDARMILTNFERAHLYCADLSGVDARQAIFRKADIRGVSLNHARLEGANFDDADMRQAVLAYADAKDGYRLVGRSGDVRPEGGGITYSVDFSNCSMKKVKLANAKLKGANFAGALMQGADLSGAVLTGANFDGGVLTGVNLERAVIDRGALAKCVVDPTATALARVAELLTRLEASDLWVRTNGREGRAAVLDDEDVRPLGDAFQKRQLAALSAQRALAVGVNFAGAQLQGTKFDGADLRDADFNTADLRGASFVGANLWHANFAGADLRPLPLGGTGSPAWISAGRDTPPTPS